MMGVMNSETRSDIPLSLAADVARRVLENGGETYRAEEFLLRTARAAGLASCEGFVIPTGIIASVDEGHHAIVRRIERRGIDLGEICRVEDLVRALEAGEIAPSEMRNRLDAASPEPRFGLAHRVVFSAWIAGFFALLFGGSEVDFGFALAIGPIAAFMESLIGRAGIPKYFNNMIGAAIIVFLALVAAAVHPDVLLSALTSGPLMLLVPGIAITNAIRDTIEGDLVAGMARGLEAFLLAAALAVGAGFALKCGDLIARSTL